MESSSSADGAPGGATADELFGTETMAELYARQGRCAEAIAIYRRLVARDPPAGRRGRWLNRLAALEGMRAKPPPLPCAAAPTRSLATPALVVEAAVRSGQVIRSDRDLVVLAPVNPGGQLVAAGHVHVYGPLRGRATAGSGGAATARLLCLRLEAELIAIGDVHAAYDDIPHGCRGRATQVSLRAGQLVFALL